MEVILILYSNLYNSAFFNKDKDFISLNEASQNRGTIFGETRRLHGLKTIENATMQNSFKNLAEKKLQNKDIYKEMKNKVLYTQNSKINTHSLLNKIE